MQSRNALSAFLLVGLAIFMLVAFFFMRGGYLTTSGMEPSTAAAFFRIVNASTLTGFQSTLAIDEYRLSGQVIMFVLTVVSSLTMLIVGGSALAKILDMPFEAGHIAKATFLIYGIAVLIGTTILAISGTSGWPAMFQAVSAFGNSGLFMGELPAWSDWRTHIILLPLAVLGGLSIPVLLDLMRSTDSEHVLHQHTRTVLTTTAALYVLGVLFIAGPEIFQIHLDWEGMTGGPTDPTFMEEARPVIVRASVSTLNSRTLGMPFGAFQELSFSSQWIVLLLMLLGGSPASTASGIKIITLYILIRDSVNILRGKQVSRVFGIAGLWTIGYLGAVFVTTVLLIYSAPQVPADRMLFLAASAVGNVGTSHSPVSLTELGMYVASGAMLFGRFAPIVIMLWAAEYLSPGRTIRHN